MYRKKVVITILCIMMCIMAVAYSSFATLLQISGTASIDSVWDIYFESITTKQIVGYASNTTNPYVNNLSATINFEMKAPGDKLVYEVVLKNNGTLDAAISEIEAEKGGAPQITYEITGVRKGDKISANSTKKITITIEYDSDVTSTPSLDETFLIINIVSVQYTGSIPSEDIQIYEPMLMKSTVTSGNTNAFLKGPITRAKIESITFTNSKTVPSGVIGSWDVSAGNDGTVMAWYYDTDKDNLYEVYIGQDGGVIANPDCSHLFRDLINVTSMDLTYLDTSKVTTMYYMFSGMSSLTNLDLSKFNTSKVTTMARAFNEMTKLKQLSLSSFDTSKVTTMRYMFFNCNSLTNLDLSSFNTSNVKEMYNMFEKCSSLITLDLSSFNTSNVTTMQAMFGYMTSLKNLDLGNFKTINVKDMSFMFQHSTSLANLNLSSFDTSNVTTMQFMFANCPNITTLDLSSFNTSNVTTMQAMFSQSTNLKTIFVSDKWTVANVTNSNEMFMSTYAIVGGNGTTYIATKWDKTYARIDGGASNPGYFTYKERI